MFDGEWHRQVREGPYTWAVGEAHLRYIRDGVAQPWLDDFIARIEAFEGHALTDMPGRRRVPFGPFAAYDAAEPLEPESTSTGLRGSGDQGLLRNGVHTVQAGMLAGRVALVTGAGRGLGASYALALAGAGATVVVNDSGVDLGGANPDPAVAGAVADEIRRAGGQAVADSTDVGSFAAAAQVVGRAVEECGRIDILVNNAGIVGSARVSDVDEQEFDALMAVHVTGTVGTIRAAFPHMRSQRHGRIVNVTSEAALSREHGPGMAYAAAKAAVWGVTMAAATEGSEFGVTVNALSPGALTRMSQSHLDRTGIPDGLDLSPARVAEVLLLLCTDAAGDITGRVVHTAAGHIREYVLARTHDSDLVRRIEAARHS